MSNNPFFTPGTSTVLDPAASVAGSVADSFGGGLFGGLSGGVGGALGAAGGLFGGIGSLISGQDTSAADQAMAQGYQAESLAYKEAAGFAQGNVDIEKEATLINQYQQQRQLRMIEGSQQAEAATSGVEMQGSALAILRSSMEQGALAKGLIGVQGTLQEQQYAGQAAAYLGLSAQASAAATAAQDAASAASSSGVLGFLGGIAGAAAHIIPFL